MFFIPQTLIKQPKTYRSIRRESRGIWRCL